MKKVLFILIGAILVMSLLTGCNRSDASETFEAKIIQVGKGSIIVMPVDGSDELRSSDLFSIHITVDTELETTSGEKGSISALKEDMNVEIAYNGIIMESYPAQITADLIRIV